MEVKAEARTWVAYLTPWGSERLDNWTLDSLVCQRVCVRHADMMVVRTRPALSIVGDKNASYLLGFHGDKMHFYFSLNCSFD